MCGNNGCFGGGNIWWIIILILLFCNCGCNSPIAKPAGTIPAGHFLHQTGSQII